MMCPEIRINEVRVGAKPLEIKNKKRRHGERRCDFFSGFQEVKVREGKKTTKKRRRNEHLVPSRTRLRETLRGRRGRGSCGRSHRCRGAVNYLGAVYFFARLLSVSFIPLLPSPFKISHREPSHSSSSVHRSLAKSTLADWSSSKSRGVGGEPLRAL